MVAPSQGVNVQPLDGTQTNINSTQANTAPLSPTEGKYPRKTPPQ